MQFYYVIEGHMGGGVRVAVTATVQRLGVKSETERATPQRYLTKKELDLRVDEAFRSGL